MDLPEFRSMAATGIGPQNETSREGGQSGTGVFDQTRPTGIVATGKRTMSLSQRGDTPGRGKRGSR